MPAASQGVGDGRSRRARVEVIMVAYGCAIAPVKRSSAVVPALVAALCVALLAGSMSCRPPRASDTAAGTPWDVTKARGKTKVVDFTTDEGTWMSVDLSADGQWVVFDLLANVYRVPASGGAAECLTCTSGAAVNYEPRYSPDGKRIGFVSDRNGQENLWVMNADGSRPKPVYDDQNSRAFEPTWTPDGTAIVATRYLPDFRGYYH